MMFASRMLAYGAVQKLPPNGLPFCSGPPSSSPKKRGSAESKLYASRPRMPSCAM
jgi:hypothetical protein